MPTVPATEFARNFGRYREEAQAEPVLVTSDGEVIGGYLAAAQIAEFERLKRRERQAFLVEDLPEELVAAIEAAEYSVVPE